MKEQLNATTQEIIAAAIAVHKALGPGLLESAYESCLEVELVARGLVVERQKPLPIAYAGAALNCAYRMDFMVNGHVIVEIKSVERIMPVHEAQMLSYLRLADKRVGLLINFNVKWLTDQGVRRFVNNFPE
jgi:GxxExxY protein